MSTSQPIGDPTANSNYIVVPASTTNPTYVGGIATTTGGSAGYVSTPYTMTTGSTTWSGAWETALTEECQFCDKEVKVGIFMKSKKGKKSFICVPCAKQHMGSEKMKDLLDLAEPVAVGEELAE
jgi:hypothetical protein